MIVDRIKKIIEYKKISTRKFCIEIGVANGFFDKVKDVGSEKVLKILKTYPEINPEWLLSGDGDMLKHEVSQTHAEFEYIQESVNELPIKKLIDYLIIKDTSNIEFIRKNQEQFDINQEQLGINQKCLISSMDLLKITHQQVSKSQEHVDELINLIKFHGNLTNGHSVLPNNHVDVFEPKVREN